MKEYNIGEKFTLQIKEVKKEDENYNNCKGCFFESLVGESEMCLDGLTCSNRKDGKNIIFVLEEKK